MKKKSHLKNIALLGLTGGALISTNGAAAPAPQYPNNNFGFRNKNLTADASTASKTQKPLTEQEFLSKLNSDSKAEYQRLDQDGKTLALKLANQSCKGQNECKGMNSCKSSENSCAGQGGCKGKSQADFKDKNTAVKVASKKMAEKRSSMMNR